MTAPSRIRYRTFLASALAIACAGAVGGFLVGRSTEPPPPVIQAPTTPQPEPKAKDEPAIPRALDRASIIGAVSAAINAAATPTGNEPLAGRAFELRIAFGCDGPAGDEMATGWQLSDDGKSMTLSVSPEDWSGLPLIAPLVEEGSVEAARGFWVSRPWSNDARCPPPAATSALGLERSIGIATLFAAESSRVGRLTEPLRATVTLDEPRDFGAGLQLAIAGRIDRWPDGRAIRCRSEDPMLRPSCLVAADIDRISVIDPATGETLSTWNP